MEKDPPQLLRMWPELDRPLQKVGKISLSSACIERDRARVSFLCVVFLFCGLWGEASKHWIAICCYLEKTESKPFASGTKKCCWWEGGGGLESVQSQIERAHCFWTTMTWNWEVYRMVGDNNMQYIISCNKRLLCSKSYVCFYLPPLAPTI